MSLLEKTLVKNESYEVESGKSILHLAILNGSQNDEIELIYNNGFSTILTIPETKVLEINSPYITISKVIAKYIQGNSILLQMELNDKTENFQGYSEENYKIQYIKGDRGNSLTWEDLTNEQRQNLSFKIIKTYSKDDLFSENETTSSIQTVQDKLAEQILTQQINLPGFYLYQNNEGEVYQSWLYYIIPTEKTENQIKYMGEFSGAKGEKGDTGPAGPPPSINTNITLNTKPLFDGGFSAEFSGGGLSEDGLTQIEKYQLNLTAPEYIYFGTNEEEANKYPFAIDLNSTNDFYYIISGGTATTLTNIINKGGIN